MIYPFRILVVSWSIPCRFGFFSDRLLLDSGWLLVGSGRFTLSKAWLLFLGDQLYIPKHSKHGKHVEWRKSYSCEERELLEEIDEENDCRKHCVRIIKALFKVRSPNLIHIFPSYFIKTVAFDLEDNKKINWTEKNLAECTIFFLKKIEKHLEEKHLCHTFEKNFNLIERSKKTDAIMNQMAKKINRNLQDEERFLKWLGPWNKLEWWFKEKLQRWIIFVRD